MSTTTDERTEMLLGRFLLGQATQDEARELEDRRRASASLRDAMDTLDRFRADYRRSAAGETLSVGVADLPDHLRPAQLADGLRRWYRRWLLSSAVCGLAILALLWAAAAMAWPEGDVARLAAGMLRAAGFVLVAGAIAGAILRERLISGVAAGGESWDRAVAAARRQEREFLSVRARNAMRAAALTTSGLIGLSLVARGTAGGCLLFAAALALTYSLRIAKRRYVLGALQGPRRDEL